jgi:hypothetical protein
MLLAQPLILMVLYAFMPLVVLFSRFSLAFLMHGAIAIFTVKFWAAMWSIARVMDERIVAALYGDTTVLVREFMTNGLDGGSKRAILNVLTVALFIVIPMMWSGMIAWVGFRIGSALNTAIEKAGSAGADAGSAATKGVGKAISSAAKKLDK